MINTAVIRYDGSRLWLEYGNFFWRVRLSIQPSPGEFDGSLDLFAQDEATATLLNCKKDDERGYIYDMDEQTIKFYLSKSANHWEDQQLIVASYTYTPEAKPFVEKVVAFNNEHPLK